MARELLHRDEVDGCIVLYRLSGDCWRVARNQDECDHFRSTEVQSPSKTRFGLAGFSKETHFVRVQRIDEEAIERPEGESDAGAQPGERRGMSDNTRYVKEEDSGGWGVTKEGHRRPTAHGATRADALRAARGHLRREGGGEIQVLNHSGKVVEAITVSV